MLKSNTAFTLVETAIVSGVVALILIIGLILYAHDHSPQAIILNRQKAIDHYLKNLSPSNYTSFGTSLYSKSLITTSLYNATRSLITGYTNGSFLSDPFFSKYICVDNLPSSFTYGAVILNTNSNKATLPVSVFVAGSPSSIPYTTNWVDTSSGWRLNSLNCH